MIDTDLNFEKALADLEGVVDKLEKGGLSLNDSLAQFEKGVGLARFLRQELDKAEKKVEILLQDEQGRERTEAFGLDEEGAEGGAAEDDEDDEEEDEESGEDDEKAVKKGKPKTPRGAKKKDDDTSLPF